MDNRNGMGGGWTGSMPSCRGMKISSNIYPFLNISNDAAICDSLTLDHGVISYSASTTPRLEGSVATHSCDEEYGRSPSVTTRTCQPDRTWSGDDIICQSKK